MKTQRELLNEHRDQLDERYLRKYPEGKFCIQYRYDMGLLEQGRDYWGIHWCPTRSTGAAKNKGISTYFRNGKIEHENHQNNCFGKCNNYDAYGKMLGSCGRQKVPIELVEAFSERYFNRKSEGF